MMHFGVGLDLLLEQGWQNDRGGASVFETAEIVDFAVQRRRRGN
jgi:hypothetical protein